MSKIFCIIDGMPDARFCIEEYRHLASMRFLRYENTSQGAEPETLNCVLHLLGVQEAPKHLRGYVEALGAGIPIHSNDLIMRGSWFHLDNNGCCTTPCEAPSTVHSSGFRYYSLGQYKCLLVYPNMAQHVSLITTHSPCSCAGQKAETLCPEGSSLLRDTFKVFMNTDKCMIPWGQSVAAQLPAFPEHAAVICGKAVVKGIARLLHMDLVHVSDATGDVDTNLEAKTAAALSVANHYPFVLLHINGADESAHRQDTDQKKQFISQIDDIVLSQLLKSSHEIVVTSDHGTDPQSGLHIGGMQPVFTND